MILLDLTPAQLRQAADLKEQIEKLQGQLLALSGGGGVPSPLKTAKPGPKPKRKISAAGIARIKAAQKARWAKVKSAVKPAPAQVVKKGRKKMSAAARAKISAAAKARWAKIKGAKQ